jgi:hypothetical protein
VARATGSDRDKSEVESDLHQTACKNSACLSTYRLFTGWKRESFVCVFVRISDICQVLANNCVSPMESPPEPPTDPKAFQDALGIKFGTWLWRICFVIAMLGTAAAGIANVGSLVQLLKGSEAPKEASKPASPQNCGVSGGINYGSISQNCDVK